MNVFVRFQNRAALLHPRIHAGRHRDEPPSLLERRRERERQRDDCGVGGAGLRELQCLRDVFAEHELWLHAVVDAGTLQRGFHQFGILQFFEAQEDHQDGSLPVLGESDGGYVVIARSHRAARFFVPWALLRIVP